VTRKEALKLIKATATDYSNKQHVLRGLAILAKYDDDISPQFEHDQMYCCDFKETVAKMSREEIEEMSRCGWFESEDAWSHF
jgi:hypothetical protein